MFTLRVLDVMDDVTRECLTAVVDTSIPDVRVARELARLVEAHGKPRNDRQRQRLGLTSNAVPSWAGEVGIVKH